MEKKIVEDKQAERDTKKKSARRDGGVLRHPAEIGMWFRILCFMNIPVFGIFYMIVKFLRKKTPAEQRSFAAAFLIFRFLVLLLAGTILFILYQIGLDFLDTLLKYADRMA